MSEVRWSSLKWMAKSPAHYQHYLEHPVPETQAMRIGARAHNLILGGGRPFSIYMGVRRGKEWEAFKAGCHDETILNEREANAAQAIATVLRRSKECMNLLGGHIERTIHWIGSGRGCCGTPDAVSLDGAVVADLKVTADADPSKFAWHASRQGWLAQLAWYSDGLRDAGLADPKEHIIVAVEGKAPHVIQPYLLTERAVEMGRRTYRLLLERLMVHEAADHWPGYIDGLATLDSPEELALTMDGEEFSV